MMNTDATTNPSAGAPDRLNTPPSGPTTADPGRRRVLIVEDDGPLRELLALLLTEAGYQVRAVGDGGGALLAAADWPPELILLDLTLGATDGGAFRAHQQAGELADVPVLVLSGDADLEARAALMGAEALGKPFDLDELLERVGRLVPTPARR